MVAFEISVNGQPRFAGDDVANDIGLTVGSLSGYRDSDGVLR
jgi:hypothetical protein